MSFPFARMLKRGTGRVLAQCAIMATCGLAATVVSSRTAIASDLLVTHFYSDPNLLSGVERYSQTGADMGAFVKTFSESTDALTQGPNGNVYTVGNTLGDGTISQYSSTGTAINSNSPWTTWGLPRGIAVGWSGHVYVGSTTVLHAGQQTGVLDFNAITLAYLGNAVPLSAPASGYAVTDLRFGPDNKLYVAEQGVVKRFSKIGGNVVLDNSYSITLSTSQQTQIGFKPGSPDLFVSRATAGTGIDEYDPSGAFVQTFLASGSGGVGGIDSFLFGGDGILYVGSGGGSGLNTGTVKRFDAQTAAFIDTLPMTHNAFNDIVIVVPEPTSAMLIAASAMALLLRRRRAKNA